MGRQSIRTGHRLTNAPCRKARGVFILRINFSTQNVIILFCPQILWYNIFMKDLKNKIYDNRWFIWTVVIIITAGMGLWGIIEVTIAKMDTDVIESNNAFLTLQIRNLSESDDILDIVFAE